MTAALSYGPGWLLASLILAAILIARNERHVDRERREASARLDFDNVHTLTFPDPLARMDGEAGRVRPSLTVLAGGSGEADPPQDLGGAA